MGIHAQRGVSCADCHMPYKSEGGVKFSDHHIQSPLAMIDRTCQVCHRESEETLRQNVYERQRKANEIRNRLETELAKAHIEAKYAWDNGATEEQSKIRRPHDNGKPIISVIMIYDFMHTLKIVNHIFYPKKN